MSSPTREGRRSASWSSRLAKYHDRVCSREVVGNEDVPTSCSSAARCVTSWAASTTARMASAPQMRLCLREKSRPLGDMAEPAPAVGAALTLPRFERRRILSHLSAPVERLSSAMPSIPPPPTAPRGAEAVGRAAASVARKMRMTAVCCSWVKSGTTGASSLGSAPMLGPRRSHASARKSVDSALPLPPRAAECKLVELAEGRMEGCWSAPSPTRLGRVSRGTRPETTSSMKSAGFSP
mmetsp:Transcript_12572/g.37785  ORF Transcript_12572/g.37785 Transcript_12572/m.37785 type:complete len:238 (+) Transcript_12572:1899-2612(+)